MKRGYGASDEVEIDAVRIAAVQQRMQDFVKDAEAVLAGRLAAITASTADHPPTAPLVMTFGSSDLLSWFQSGTPSFAVHHGPLAAAPGLYHVKLPTEHVMPFASAKRQPLAIAHGTLRDVLAGTVSDWAAFGQRPGPIRVLAHGGALHRRKFETAIELAGLDIAIPIERHSSYAELARAAGRCSDCIVFGLRPEHVEAAGVMPVSLDGALPWRPNRVAARSGLPIHIVWRDEVSAVSAAAVQSFLETARRKLTADARMMLHMERISEGKPAERALAFA